MSVYLVLPSIRIIYFFSWPIYRAKVQIEITWRGRDHCTTNVVDTLESIDQNAFVPKALGDASALRLLYPVPIFIDTDSKMEQDLPPLPIDSTLWIMFQHSRPVILYCTLSLDWLAAGLA